MAVYARESALSGALSPTAQSAKSGKSSTSETLRGSHSTDISIPIPTEEVNPETEKTLENEKGGTLPPTTNDVGEPTVSPTPDDGRSTHSAADIIRNNSEKVNSENAKKTTKSAIHSPQPIATAES